MRKNLEDELSMQRTLMSSERTMLSQSRTGFVSILLGLALINFFDDPTSFYFGWFFNILGAVILFLSPFLHILRNKRLEKFWK